MLSHVRGALYNIKPVLNFYRYSREFLLKCKLIVKYGTASPNFVYLKNSKSKLFVNNLDLRGQGLVMNGGVTNQRLIDCFNSAVRQLNPDLVIDVGMNYGEFVFSSTYSDQCRVYGVEGNPELIRFIEKSKETHPNKLNIQILNILAGNESKEVSFYINSEWSGTSCISDTNIKGREKHQLKMVRLQDEIKPGQNFVFKMDIEGFEYFALKGMEELINASDKCLGILEFNRPALKSAGADFDELFQFLNKYFDIAAFTPGRELKKLSKLDDENLNQIFGLEGKQMTDLVLFKNCGPLKLL